MTEEIIIDGINVAGCEHYCEKLNTGSGFIQNTSKQGFCLHNITGLQNADIYFRVLSFPKCREQSNCHYKQLKRLEQENKSLYEEKNCLHKIIDRLLENAGYSKDIASAEDFEDVYEDMQIKRNELIELEQENKELKEKVKSLESEIRQKKRTIMMNNDHYLTVDENNRKYRSALEEILESAKFAQCLPCGSVNLEDCLNCADDTTNNGQFCMEKRIHEIKTKCVEVLNHSEG